MRLRGYRPLVVGAVLVISLAACRTGRETLVTDGPMATEAQGAQPQATSLATAESLPLEPTASQEGIPSGPTQSQILEGQVLHMLDDLEQENAAADPLTDFP